MNNILTLSYSDPKKALEGQITSEDQVPRGEFLITKDRAVQNDDGEVKTKSKTITDIKLVKKFRAAIKKRDKLHSEIQALKKGENTEDNKRLYLEKRTKYKEIETKIEAMSEGLSAIMALAIKNDHGREQKISQQWGEIIKQAFPEGLYPVF